MTDTQHTRRRFLGTLAAGAFGAPLVARAGRIDARLGSALEALSFQAEVPASLARLEGQYMLSDALTYLNHASIGTVPRPVMDAHQGYLELCESHPSLYVWGGVWREVTEETRSAAATLLSCDPDDLSITHNTTEGFNILAHGLPLQGGDEVLFSSLNHSGASVAWDVLGPRLGFTVRRFDFPIARAPELTEEEIVEIHTAAIRPQTRVLVIPHVDNMVGLRHPIEGIARAAKARGVEWVLVDGAQSAGMIPVALGGSGVDAYAMSPHKWIQAPKGLGLFYTTPALRTQLPRMWHKTPESRMDGTGRDYEDYSTRAWPAVVALGDALAFQASLGEGEKLRRYRAQWRLVRNRVEEDPALEWRSPTAWQLGSMIVSVGVRGRAAPEVGPLLLERHGVVLRSFGGKLNALRVSPNLMTSDASLDRFLDLISRMGA
jgi:selenocysteine lyase/cysteine desulfurase